MDSEEPVPFVHLSLEPWAALPEGSWKRPLFFKFGLKKDGDAGYSFIVTDYQRVWSEDMSDAMLKTRIASEYPSLVSTPIPDVLSLLSRLTTSVLAVKPSSDQTQVLLYLGVFNQSSNHIIYA